MTLWHQEKRRNHPHGLIQTLERMLRQAAARKAPARRARRSKSQPPRGSMTRTKM